MSKQYTVSQFGYLEESTKGTDPITTSGTAYYQYGQYQKSIGNLPTEKLDVGIYRHGTYSPSGWYLKSRMVEHEFICTPVNGQGNYLAQVRNGSGVTHNAGVFTIVPVESGGITSVTNRYDVGVGAGNDREHFVGNVTTMYSETIDFDNDPELQAVYNQLGIRRVDPGFDANNAPVFPSSKESTYKVDTNTIMTWDYGGDNVDILPYVSSFSWTHVNFFLTKMKDGQLYINTSYKKNHIQTINIIMKRAIADMWVDFKDFISNATARDLRFKIYNSATEYKDYTFQNCVFLGFDKNQTVNAENEPIYSMLLGVTTMTTDVKDGLATGFYGV